MQGITKLYKSEIRCPVCGYGSAPVDFRGRYWHQGRNYPCRGIQGQSYWKTQWLDEISEWMNYGAR